MAAASMRAKDNEPESDPWHRGDSPRSRLADAGWVIIGAVASGSIVSGVCEMGSPVCASLVLVTSAA